MNYRNRVISFYTNKGVYPKDFFNLLQMQSVDSKIIYEKISYRKKELNNTAYYKILDYFEDTVHTTDIMNNYSKWLRSSFSISNQYIQGNNKSVQLRQNQTVESLLNENSYSDVDESFVEVALDNRVKETDYDLQGGIVLRLSRTNQNTNQRIIINSVVDVITPDNILGKDIDKKITFYDNDLLTLSCSETFKQDSSILLSLKRGENPEFKEEGNDKSLLSNKGVLNLTLPILIRQLYKTISTDDTIDSFQIKNINIDKDALFIEVNFKAKEGTITSIRL